MDIAREQRHAATMDIASHAVAWQSPSSEGSGAVGLPRRPPWVDSSQLPHIFWTLRGASGDAFASSGCCEARQPRSNPPAPVRLNQRTLRGASGDVAISQPSLDIARSFRRRGNLPAQSRRWQGGCHATSWLAISDFARNIQNGRTLRGASGDAFVSSGCCEARQPRSNPPAPGASISGHCEELQATRQSPSSEGSGGREVATPLRGSQSPTSLAISRMTLRGASSDLRHPAIR